VNRIHREALQFAASTQKPLAIQSSSSQRNRDDRRRKSVIALMHHRANPSRGSQQLRYRNSLTPFLPATVLRGPFRVRALVRVR
jgi:hypothetical protein